MIDLISWVFERRITGSNPVLDNMILMTIKFPAYQNYNEAIIASNDAIMALLVAVQLTGDFLEQHPDRETLLPGLFDRVPEIKRLNRSSEDAMKILMKSESSLANMAIVYILTIHQAFMNDVVKLLQDYSYEVTGRDSKGTPATIDSENVYKAIEECCGGVLDYDLLKLFYFVRRIRNRIAHYGGRPGYNLRQESKLMTKSDQSAWEALTQRPLGILLAKERIELTSSELIAALALSRRVVMNVHDLLITRIDRKVWTKVLIKDYADRNPIRFKNTTRRLKHVQGHANHFYSGLHFTEDELENGVNLYISSVK